MIKQSQTEVPHYGLAVGHHPADTFFPLQKISLTSSTTLKLCFYTVNSKKENFASFSA